MQPLFQYYTNMKYAKIILIAVLVAVLSSCGGKKESAEPEQINGMPAMKTEGADSTAVRKLVSDFMDQVIAKEFDMALGMLSDTYAIDSVTGEPMPLSQSVADAYRSTFKEFNITDYTIRQITFSDYKDNEVRCEVVVDGAIPTNWYFKPIKCVGKWYLGMRDTSRGDRPMHMDD